MKKALAKILLLTALLFVFTACEGGGAGDPGANEYYSGGGTQNGGTGGGSIGGGGGNIGGGGGGNIGGGGGGNPGGGGGGGGGGGNPGNGCSIYSSGNIGGAYGGYTYSTGWPSQSVRNQYGIGGLSQPPGSNFCHVVVNDPDAVGVIIIFTPTNATLNRLNNWFESDGWVAPPYQSDDMQMWYKEAYKYGAIYMTNTNDYAILILTIDDDYDDYDDWD